MAFSFYVSDRNDSFIVTPGDVVIVESATGVRLPFTVHQAGITSSEALVEVDEDGGSDSVSEDEVIPAGGYLLLLDS